MPHAARALAARRGDRRFGARSTGVSDVGHLDAVGGVFAFLGLYFQRLRQLQHSLKLVFLVKLSLTISPNMIISPYAENW